MSRRDGPPPAFLLEANYYRLAYQLAAQRANGAAASGVDPPRHLEVAAVGTTPLELAAAEVERLGAHVTQALDYIDRVAAASTWPSRRRLTDKERRLQRFLMSTVRPSVELILAGMQARHDPEGAQARAESLLEHFRGAAVDYTGLLRYSRVTIVPWSYRAYYNLACFATALDADRKLPWLKGRNWLREATGRDRGPDPDIEVKVGIWALHQAFRLARDRARNEVVRWATEDPSLELLRTREPSRAEFDALVERYRPARGAEQPDYTITRWTREDEREDLEDDNEGLPEDWRLELKRRALDELLLDRPGYEAHRDAKVTSKDSTVSVRIDALLQAKASAKPDILIDIRVFASAEPRGSGTVAERALGRHAQYRAITARSTKVWLIIVAEDDAPLVEQDLRRALAGNGDATVLTPRELPALRRLPLPE